VRFSHGEEYDLKAAPTGDEDVLATIRT